MTPWGRNSTFHPILLVESVSYLGSFIDSATLQTKPLSDEDYEKFVFSVLTKTGISYRPKLKSRVGLIAGRVCVQGKSLQLVSWCTLAWLHWHVVLARWLAGYVASGGRSNADPS